MDMNLKKLFAGSMLVALVATMLPVVNVNASYSEELKDAYAYALEKQITTMPSIDQANPYGAAYRSHMAKMISNWATSVLDLKADEDAKCLFIDTYNESEELKGYIKLSCQLGLMGQWVVKFRPNDVVSRAEFGTVLSRALWGDKYDGATPYYESHLDALKDAKIMTDLSNPMRSVKRYEVWLMLMRADDDYTPVVDNKCSASEVLACLASDDYSACLAECSGDTPDPDPVDPEEPDVKDGDLVLELGDDSYSNMTSVPLNWTVEFAELEVSAKSSNIEVLAIEVSKVGLWDLSDIGKMWFEIDWVRVSSRASLDSEGNATISFTPSLDVKKGSTSKFDLVAKLEGTDAGGEHAFKIVNVVSSAENEDYKVTTPTLRTTNYTVGQIDVAAKGSNTTHKASDNDLELGRFTLTNNSNDEKEVDVKALTFRNTGNGDLENLDNLSIFLDGDNVTDKVNYDGKYATFSLDNVILESAKTKTFYIRGDVNFVDSSDGDTYQFELRNSDDVTAVEVKNDFRVELTTATPVTFSEYLVEGSDVMFERDTTLESRTVTPGADDEKIILWNVKVTEGVTLEDVKLDINLTNAASGTELSDVVSKMRLVIGGSSSTFTPVANETEAFFEGTFTISKDSEVALYVDIKSNAGSATLTTESLDLQDFAIAEYTSSDNTVDDSVGSISAVTLTVVESKLYLTRTDGISATNVVIGSKDIVVFGGEFSTTTDTPITVNSFDLKWLETATDAFDGKLFLSLYVDGVVAKSQTYRWGKATFSSLNIDVEKGEDVSIEIKADFNDTITTGSTVKFTATEFVATDDNSKDVTIGDVSTELFTVIEAGQIEVSSNGSSSSKLLSAESKAIELGQFNLIATNDTLKLTDFYIKNSITTWGADITNRLNSFKLVVDGKEVPGNPRDGIIIFEDMGSLNIKIDSNSTKTVKVIANISSNSNLSSVSWANLVQLAVADDYTVASGATPGTLNGIRLMSDSNNNAITTVNLSTTTIGEENRLVRWWLTVAKKSFNQDRQNAMKFTVAANGNRVAVSWVTIHLAQNAVTADDVSVYKNGSESPSNLVGSGAFATGNIVIDFATWATVEITEGSPSNFLVVLTNATPAADANYTVKLADVKYVDYFNDGKMNVDSVKNYDNVGLPVSANYGN